MTVTVSDGSLDVVLHLGHNEANPERRIKRLRC